MAQHDYKSRGVSSTGKRKHAGGTLIGIVIGLLLGLMLAVAVAFYLNRGPKPFADKTGRGEKSAPRAGADNSDPNKPLFGKDAKSGDTKGAAPAKDGEKRFSFYEILPGKEEVVDPQKALEAARAETRAEAAKGEAAKGEAAKARPRHRRRRRKPISCRLGPSAPQVMPTTRKPSWRYLASKPRWKPSTSKVRAPCIGCAWAPMAVSTTSTGCARH